MLGDIQDPLLMITSEPQHGPSGGITCPQASLWHTSQDGIIKKESICVPQAWKKRLDSLSTPPLGTWHIPDRPIYILICALYRMNERHFVCLPWSCKLYCREVKSKKKKDENVAFNTAFKNGSFYIPHQFEASFRLFPFIQPQLLPQYKSIKAQWCYIYLPGDRSWEHQGLCDRVRTLKTKTMKPQRLENNSQHQGKNTDK